MQNGQLRTSCCSRVIHQFWWHFVFDIDIAGVVFNNSSPRAKWRTNSRKLVRLTHPKKKRKRGSMVFLLTSQKTKIAKSACEPRRQGLLAEDALAKLYLGQKNLVSWQRLVTKSSTRRVNQETITGTLSWFRILPLNGFNPIRAKQRLLRRRRGVNESSSSRRTKQK